MWDTIKRPNLLIIGITEAEESQIFNKTTEANFPQIKEGHTHTDIGSTKNTIQSQKRNTPQHIIAKTLKIQNKEKILEAAREKTQLTYKGKPFRKPLF